MSRVVGLRGEAGGEGDFVASVVPEMLTGYKAGAGAGVGAEGGEAGGAEGGAEEGAEGGAEEGAEGGAEGGAERGGDADGGDAEGGGTVIADVLRCGIIRDFCDAALGKNIEDGIGIGMAGTSGGGERV